MTRRHTPETRRIQSRLERLELQHLRDVVAEQSQRLDDQAEELGDLQQRLDYAESALEWRWDQTMRLGHELEEKGIGHLGFSIDGTLCVLAGGPPELGLSS